MQLKRTVGARKRLSFCKWLSSSAVTACESVEVSTGRSPIAIVIVRQQATMDLCSKIVVDFSQSREHNA